MAASFQAVGTGATANPAWPTHATGDVGYLIVHSEAANVSTPSGWDLVPGFPAGNVAATVFIYAFQRVAASAAEGAVSITGGTVPYAVIITARGATGYLASAAAGGSGAVTTGQTPGIYNPGTGVVVFEVLAWAIANAGPIASSWTCSSLTGFTEQFDAGTASGGGGGLTIATGTLASAGAIVPATVTLTSTQYAGGVIVIGTPSSGSSTYSRGRIVNA